VTGEVASRLIRRALGLPAKAPQAPKPASGERERILRRRAAWHAEDPRADIAYALARLPITVRLTKDRALREVEIVRGTRALASARTLRYTSIYILPIRGCTDIEGHFDFGSKGSFQLSLLAVGSVNRWVISEWENGDPLTDDGLQGLLGGRHVFIPGDELTPSLPPKHCGAGIAVGLSPSGTIGLTSREKSQPSFSTYSGPT
jgi:hypothetical protein